MPSDTSWWSKLLGFVGTPIGAALLAAVVALGGWLFHDFADFTSEYRKTVEKQYESSVVSSKKIGDDLHAFATQALGQKNVEDKVRESFKLDMTALYRSVEEISRKFPEAEPEYKKYVDSMASLQSAALEMKGPGDAKQFWEEMSRFLAAEKEFNAKITKERHNYIQLLRKAAF